MSKLSIADFLHVVAHTPLVSIDMILENQDHKILIGKRVNDPAKDYWFVPGGRVLKNETFSDCLTRLMKEELGLSHFDGTYTILGVYDHFYETCFYKQNPNSTTTHYVCIGVKIHFDDQLYPVNLRDQHSGYRWVGVQTLLDDPYVHNNTKNYFLPRETMIKF